MSFNPTDGFVATTGALTLDDTTPMFMVDPVQLQFSVEADFVAAQVANNVLILARSDGRILRIDLNKPEDIDGTSWVAFLTLLPSPPPFGGPSDLHRRRRPSKETLRDGRYPAHVPRSDRLTSPHMHDAWRQLLPTLAVQGAQGPASATWRVGRERGLEPSDPHIVHPRDPHRSLGRQHIRNLPRDLLQARC